MKIVFGQNARAIEGSRERENTHLASRLQSRSHIARTSGCKKKCIQTQIASSPIFLQTSSPLTNSRHVHKEVEEPKKEDRPRRSSLEASSGHDRFPTRPELPKTEKDEDDPADIDQHDRRDFSPCTVEKRKAEEAERKKQGR